MDKLPAIWYIKNDYQEVRDFLAAKCDRKGIKTWRYPYVGYRPSIDCDNGAHGCDIYHITQEDIRKGEKTQMITIEEFRQMVSPDLIINSYSIF